MIQQKVCPGCGRFAVLKEQHRFNGTYPSHDKFRRPIMRGFRLLPTSYQPLMLCQDCIEAALLSEAERRRIRARTKALLERRKRLVLT